MKISKSSLINLKCHKLTIISKTSSYDLLNYFSIYKQIFWYFVTQFFEGDST